MVDVRVVLVSALLAGASRIIFAHTHPSGDLTPSADDKKLTAALFAGGRAIGVELLDSLIIANDGQHKSIVGDS